MAISIKKTLADAAKAPTEVEGKLTVKHPDGSETEEVESIPADTPVSAHPVMVGVSIGITRNLGNFESIKAQVSITIPCDPDPDEIDETYASAKDWVDARINAFNDEINENVA